MHSIAGYFRSLEAEEEKTQDWTTLSLYRSFSISLSSRLASVVYITDHHFLLFLSSTFFKTLWSGSPINPSRSSVGRQKSLESSIRPFQLQYISPWELCRTTVSPVLHYRKCLPSNSDFYLHKNGSEARHKSQAVLLRSFILSEVFRASIVDSPAIPTPPSGLSSTVSNLLHSLKNQIEI